MALAKRQHVPPYVICSDATLQSMCRIRPQTREGMLSVSGMGEVKTQKYGDAFLKVLREYSAGERRMRQQVSTLARSAQSFLYRPAVPPSAAAELAAGKAQEARRLRIVEPPREAPVPPPRPPLEDDDESLADAYLSGVSTQELADELGVSPAVIRQRLRDLDLIF